MMSLKVHHFQTLFFRLSITVKTVSLASKPTNIGDSWFLHFHSRWLSGFKSAHFHIELLTSQTLHRVGHCCFYRLETYGEQCNEQCQYTSNQEYYPAYFYSVSITFQPVIHYPPGNREGDEAGNGNEF